MIFKTVVYNKILFITSLNKLLAKLGYDLILLDPN